MQREDLIEQLRGHLASLKAAGVEWLPSTPPDAPPLAFFAEDAPVAETPLPVDANTDRRVALEQLAGVVAKCTRCPSLASSRTQTVFGIGPFNPEICFVGEAPGADEDRQGEPFVGAAGQLLTRIITACGMKREDVYICNILKCRPPGNRTPQADEAAHCSEYLQQQLELIQPRFLCCLGGTAAKYLLNSTASIGALRGKVLNYRGIPVVCTYHPAYLLPHRSDSPQVLHERKKLVWEDMKFLMEKLGRPVTGKP